MSKFVIYSDGGARGNPGPAAIGYLLQDEGGRTLKTAGEAIGETTNNVAEYRAAIAALKKLKSLIGRENAKRAQVEVRMDSELVIRQVNAEYKVKEPQLVPFFVELFNARQDFGSVTFQHVRREENRKTDRLVNDALDGNQKSAGLAL